MADEKRKSRREVLYDKGRKPEPKEDPQEEPSADSAAGGGAGDAGMPAEPATSPTQVDMFKRHEADRRTMHGNHRSEHRAIENEAGDDVLQKKLAAHRRHRNEMDSLHEKHEQELLEQLAALQKREGADQGEAA